MPAKSSHGASFLCVPSAVLPAPSLQRPLERLGLRLVPANYNYIRTLLEVGDDEWKCVWFPLWPRGGWPPPLSLPSVLPHHLLLFLGSCVAALCPCHVPEGLVSCQPLFICSSWLKGRSEETLCSFPNRSSLYRSSPSAIVGAVLEASV